MSERVTVEAVDANWNLVSSTHTIAITSSDGNAGLPANAALVAGSQTFSVTFKTVSVSGWTVTATDQAVSPLTANTGTPTPVTADGKSKRLESRHAEISDAGTGMGKRGSPTSQTAG